MKSNWEEVLKDRLQLYGHRNWLVIADSAYPAQSRPGIETIVAVRHPSPPEQDQSITVVSPCGACRELIWDYDRNARVIVPGPSGPSVVAIGDLLPNKYRRERTL